MSCFCKSRDDSYPSKKGGWVGRNATFAKAQFSYLRNNYKVICRVYCSGECTAQLQYFHGANCQVEYVGGSNLLLLIRWKKEGRKEGITTWFVAANHLSWCQWVLCVSNGGRVQNAPQVIFAWNSAKAKKGTFPWLLILLNLLRWSQ